MKSPVGDQRAEQLDPFEVSQEFIISVLESDEIEQIESYHKRSISGRGDVYTPEEIVDFILDSIGYTIKDPIEHSRILDVACGTGSFVAEIVRRLRERLKKAGYEPTDEQGARQIISTIRNNVHAFDFSEDAILRTAQMVISLLETEIRTLGIDNSISSVPVYQIDTLDQQSKIDRSGFEYIVGNPPYIRNNDIPKERAKTYREEYSTATGKFDLYSLFFERGVQLLAQNGTLGYITPDRFFQANYGEPLRNLLSSEVELHRIVKLKDNPFPEVDTYPTIMLLKGKEQPEFGLSYQYDTEFEYCVAETSELKYILEKNSNESINSPVSCTKYAQSDLSSDRWEFLPPGVANVKEYIQEQVPIIDQSTVRFKTGIASAADDVFVLDKSEAVPIEDELLYPLIKGEDIEKGEIQTIPNRILNPYDRRGKLVDINQYPNAVKYLQRHREKLEERYCVRSQDKSWYETHDRINTNEELKERIVTPDITSEAKFAITKGTISHNTCYSVFCPSHLESLAAYLNSSLFECLLATSMPDMSSGHWRQLKRDISQLPVLEPHRLSEEERRQLGKAFESKDWEQVDQYIYRILDVSSAQQQVIEQHAKSK